MGKTNPIQTQYKPNQTQLKPIKCQNKANTNPKQTQSVVSLSNLFQRQKICSAEQSRQKGCEIFGLTFCQSHFGCHPVCIYPYLSTAISADYHAYATRVVEQMEGGICLFTLGLAGDTVPVRRGVKPRQEIGKALGGEALRRLQLVTTTGSATLKALKREIKFPTKKAPSPNETADDNKTIDYVTTEIQVLRPGDIYILGLPGEILVEVGIEIKTRAGLENLFIVTLSNDTIGYVCHSRAYEEGGYEPGPGTNLAKGAGEIMIKEALDILSQIKQNE